jgi:hypothetical protein
LKKDILKELFFNKKDTILNGKSPSSPLAKGGLAKNSEFPHFCKGGLGEDFRFRNRFNHHYLKIM